MFRYYFAGLLACLGLAAPAIAQPAAKFARPATGVTQVRYQEPGGRPPAAQPGGAAALPGQLPGTVVPKAAGPGTPAATLTMPNAVPTAAGPSTYMDGSCDTCAEECVSCTSCLCGPPGRIWVSAEWLYWKGTAQNMPPTITSAPAGTPRATAGALGQASTSIVYSGATNGDWRNGLRINAGFWLDQCQLFGIQANYFFLTPSQQGATAGSDGSQIITRPFFNVNENRQDTQLVSSPGVLAGTTVTSSNSGVSGFNPNFLMNLKCDPCANSRLDLLLGYQYFNLNDTITITEDLTALPGSNIPAGTRFQINDTIRTQNTFNGVNIGLQWEKRWSHWYVNAHGGVALGNMKSVTNISGTTTITSGGSTTFPGGLLTQPSNIGTFTSNKFAVIPMGGARVGIQVTPRMRAFVGYDFMYVSNVQRAADQIDLRVNTTQLAPTRSLVGTAAPIYTPRTTDYWLHGLSVGAEIRF